MTIKNVKKMGEESLFTPSMAVTDLSLDYLPTVLQEMQETMHAKGGVGIAAPQIGYNLRIIMFGFERSARYPTEKPVPFTILINPQIEILSEEQEERWEGCLSVPGMRGLVPRYTKLKYTGLDPEGNVIRREAEGFHARVVQHECDHIDGILFPQRIKNLANFGFEEVLWGKIYGDQKRPNSK